MADFNQVQTLDDIEGHIHVKATGDVGPNSGKPLLEFDGEVMHELSTTEWVKRGNLKQEAIKDIKAVQTLENNPLDKAWEKITGHRIRYSEEAKQGIINYIKWKNNLTEEDLK